MGRLSAYSLMMTGWSAAFATSGLFLANTIKGNKEPDFMMAMCLGWLAFIVYALNQKVSSILGSKNQTWSSEEKKKIVISFLKYVGVFVMVPVVWLLFKSDWKTWISIGLVGIVAMAYSYPLLGKEWRKIPGAKGLLLTISWLLITGIPLWGSHQGVVWLDNGLFIFLTTQIFDWRDRQKDQERQTRTIPLLLGARLFKLIFVFLATVWAMIVPQQEQYWMLPCIASWLLFLAFPISRKYYIWFDILVGLRGVFLLLSYVGWP